MNLKFILSVFLSAQTLCFGVSPSSKGDLILVTHAKNEDAHPAKHPFIKVFDDPKSGLFGFKDKNNKIILQPMYAWACDFTVDHVADVRDAVDSKWYKINPAGKKLAQCYIFDNGPDYEHLGLSRFEKNGKVGFINRKGESVIEADYDYARPFLCSQPITFVCKGCVIEKLGCCDLKIKGGKWSIINKKGEKVIPIDFTDVSYDDRDRSPVMTKDKEKYKVFINNKTGAYQVVRQ